MERRNKAVSGYLIQELIKETLLSLCHTAGFLCSKNMSFYGYCLTYTKTFNILHQKYILVILYFLKVPFH